MGFFIIHLCSLVSALHLYSIHRTLFFWKYTYAYASVAHNTRLWVTKTNQPSVEEELKRRKWRWIGHTLRKLKHNSSRQALQWNPQGKRGRGRPRNTWRRDFIAKMEIEGYRWQDLERMAQNRTRWRTVVSGLCTTKVQQA